MPDRLMLLALIDGAVTDQTDDRTMLMTLSARCWPGRDDRTVPAGRHWIRAWGPRPMSVVPHECDDPSHCGFCN